MEPEISQIATRLGHLSRGLRVASVITSPPCRSARRIVRRQSGCRPGRATLRRDRIGGTGRARRAISRRASAISAAAHQFKVQRLQPLRTRGGKTCVDLDLGPALGHVGQRAALPVQQRLGGALLPRPRLLLGLRAAHHRQQHRHHVFQKRRVAPEQAKHLREHLALLGAVHEDRVQGPVEIRLAVEPRLGHGPHRLDHPARPDGQPGPTQRAGEMGDVLHQPPVGRTGGHPAVTCGFHCGANILRGVRGAQSPPALSAGTAVRDIPSSSTR